jgi:hypothetical protein
MNRLLTVFLPVYNRGSLTASFIEHLRHIKPDFLSVRTVIFNDSCTDDTIEKALRVEPSATVIDLDGSAYWGGSINRIRQYVHRHVAAGDTSDYYLLANDDIRYLSPEGFLEGLKAVNNQSIACASGIRIDHNMLDSTGLRLPVNFQPSSIFYDLETGSFGEAQEGQVANVAPTYSMLSTKEAWLTSSPIPHWMPHYLSDYWLTYKLCQKGFILNQPPEFTCFVSSTATNNQQPSETIDSIYQYSVRLHSFLDSSSPIYLPAWIRFLASGKPSAKRYFKIFVLCLKYASAVILTRVLRYL